MVELLLTAPSLSILSQLDWQNDEDCTTSHGCMLVPKITTWSRTTSINNGQITMNQNLYSVLDSVYTRKKEPLGTIVLKTMVEGVVILSLNLLYCGILYLTSWNPPVCWANRTLNFCFWLTPLLCVTTFVWNDFQMASAILWQSKLFASEMGRRNIWRRLHYVLKQLP